MSNIMRLVDNITGKQIIISIDGDNILNDVDIKIGSNGGKLVTYEELSDVANLPTAFLEAVSGAGGIDEAAVLSMFTKAGVKTLPIATDKLSIIEVGIGDAPDVIKSITYADFLAGLKTYFDTVYTGGGGAGGIVGTSTAPILSGVNVANEMQSIIVTVDNYDPSSIYTFDVSGGSFSRSAGIVTWLLPTVADSEAHKLTVTVTNPGKTPTAVFHPVNVFNINTTVDSIVLYEGTSMSEMTSRNNVSIIDNKLVATSDTTLYIVDNKVVATHMMDVNDKILVDNITYEINEIQAVADGSLNTSTTNLVPILTSNTSALGTAGEVISSPTTPANTGYNAFNGSSSVFWQSDNNFIGSFIGFKYNTPVIINKYSILHYTTAMDYNRAITSWKMQASNDGATWVDLHTISGASNFINGEYRTYTFSNSMLYKQYRLYVTANGGNTTAELVKLKLISTPLLVTKSQPVLPQFITTAKLLTKYAESNVITQDSYETDFTGVSGLEAIYEQYNLVSPSATITSLPTPFLNIGDIAFLGNSTDGEKSITVTSINYVNSVLDISSLGFTVIPTYGYRKDAELQPTIGNLSFEAKDRVDTILTTPLFMAPGDNNTSTTNKVPVLTGPTTKVTGSSVYEYSGYELWRAFDGIKASGTAVCLFKDAAIPWIAYDFTVPIVVNKYGISDKFEWNVPTAWTFSGSNDGTNWVTLDGRSNITWSSTYQTKWFTFDGHVKYRYYRLQITEAASATGPAATTGFMGLNELIIVEGILPKMQIKASYADIITGTSARTMKFKIKLNRIDDSVSKLSAILQKL